MEYRANERVKAVFVGQPYVTIHMSAKDRNEYKSFRKGGHDVKKPLNHPRPMGFQPQGFGMGMGMVPFGMNQPPMPMPGLENKMGQPMQPMGMPLNTEPRK